MSRTYFNVRPRYTSGSPGPVGEENALRVAEQEKRAIEHDLSGIHGAEDQVRAVRLGLGPQPDAKGVRRGIAEAVEEHRDHWMVRDMLTGEMYQRPFSTSDDRRPVKALKRCDRCSAAHERAQAV